MRARLTMTPDRLIGDIKQCATCLAQFVLPRLWYEARAPWNVFALKGFLAGIFASAGISWWTQFCQAANGWYNFFYINKMPVLLRFFVDGTLFSWNCWANTNYSACVSSAPQIRDDVLDIMLFRLIHHVCVCVFGWNRRARTTNDAKRTMRIHSM